LMGGLLHLVQRGGAWAGCGQCTNFILFDMALALHSTALTSRFHSIHACDGRTDGWTKTRSEVVRSVALGS